LARYIARRFGFMLMTLWIVITLTFVMMHAIPGDPFTSDKMTPAIRANLNAKYGLDKPLYQQYLIYFNNLLHGELGVSMQSKTRTVNEMIGQHFPVSAELALWSLSYSIAGGLLLGVIAALRRNKLADYVAMGIAVFGIAVPSFVLATIVQFLFGVELNLLPVAGWDTGWHRLLPAFVLGLGTLAGMARLMRSSMLDVLGQDYIKTAKAKGLAGSEIVWRHAIRNAILPIVTVLGTTLVGLMVGSFIIETIFGIPGLGKYYIQSITNNDYTLILGTTVFYAVLLVVSLFLVDVAYSFVDPRIRFVKGKS
jgi:oligopeptide transport system permease protein